MIESENLREIGKFQKTHALQGELNAIVDVDIDFFEMGFPVIVEMDNIFVPFYVDTVRPKGNTTILLKLTDIDSEEAAKKFVNKTIFAMRSDLKKYADEIGEDYFEEDSLIGYDVYNADDGTKIGVLEEIEDSTENILFLVSTGEDSIYLPANDELIRNIDDDARRIDMIVPEGIADINRIHEDNDEL